MPGHEIVGRVTKVGGAVTKFKVGDSVGVGCMVDSCGTCPSCARSELLRPQRRHVHLQQPRQAHAGQDDVRRLREEHRRHRAFRRAHAEGPGSQAAAPLLCAGITTYSPLKHWGVGPGKKVGIVGLGGLGHMAVKFASAFGAHTVLFTTSPKKVADGKKLGADEVVISTDADAMAKHAGSFDFILDYGVRAARSRRAHRDAAHQLDVVPLGRALDAAPVAQPVPADPQAPQHRRLRDRHGIAETQEVLDFCGKRGITSDVEMIPIQKIEDAYRRMLASDVKYRFVIDMASLS